MRLGIKSPGPLKEAGLAPRTSGTPRLCWSPGPPLTGSVHLNTSETVLSMVNKLYLETHRGWGMEQIPPETPPETAERHSSGSLGWTGPWAPEGRGSHGHCSVGPNSLLTSSPQEPRPSPGLLG